MIEWHLDLEAVARRLDVPYKAAAVLANVGDKIVLRYLRRNAAPVADSQLIAWYDRDGCDSVELGKWRHVNKWPRTVLLTDQGLEIRLKPLAELGGRLWGSRVLALDLAV